MKALRLTLPILTNVKNYLEEIAVKATYIFLAIATLYFAGHLAYYFIAIKPNAEVPTIDGVPMRNEAQMFNGY